MCLCQIWTVATQFRGNAKNLLCFSIYHTKYSRKFVDLKDQQLVSDILGAMNKIVYQFAMEPNQTNKQTNKSIPIGIVKFNINCVAYQ